MLCLPLRTWSCVCAKAVINSRLAQQVELDGESVFLWLSAYRWRGLVTSFSQCSCSPTCLWTTSGLPPHPAARTRAAMQSRRWSAATAWRRPATWTAPGRASPVTPPASIAHPHVSRLTWQPLIVFDNPLLLSRNIWSYAFLFVFAPEICPFARLTPHFFFPCSKPTKDINPGWSHGICQRPVQSQLGPWDHHEPQLPCGKSQPASGKVCHKELLFRCRPLVSKRENRH